MNKKTYRALILIILSIFFVYQHALSWDDNVTHKDLSRYVTESSVLSTNKGNYLNNIGIAKGLDEFTSVGYR